MDRIITKTLADLYLKQGHLKEAYEIYKALFEKDPFDQEVKEKLDELSQKLNLSPPADQWIRSPEERIQLLQRWLANIREKKRM